MTKLSDQKLKADFSKLFISMRYFLLGLMQVKPEYKVALEALEYAATIHTGLRKDGATPEFQHQLEIAHNIRTLLPYLIYPAETLAAIFLHDTPEDYPVTRQELERRFGKLVSDATMLLNKYDEQGVEKPTASYYSAMAHCPICSVAKPGDRGHNQSTMGGVFKFKKQYEYIMVTRDHIFPMMKVARRLFPQQEPVYENLKFLLRNQFNQTLTMLEALDYDPETGEIHPALQA